MRFKRVAESYVDLMARYNRPIRAWNPDSLEKMKELPEERLNQIIANLERQLSYYIAAEKEKISPLEEVRVLWRIMAKEKFNFCNDLFPKLENNDVIEVYLPDFTQFFANSTFMANCSYALSDLYAYEWHQLFSRPVEATEQIISKAQTVFSMPFSERSTIEFEMEPHIGTEVFSAEKRRLQINMGVISPLYDQNKNIAGALATFRPKRLDN